jgi:hypothetical protein
VVLASVDGQLITGPQVLRPGAVYELGLEIRPCPWPDWADRLEAELISHLTTQEAQTPAFSWSRPWAAEPGEALTGTGTLILRFGLPAGRPAPPFLITLRWRGTRDGKPVTEALDIAGHRELRLRPFDASRDFLMEFHVFDERLLALYEQLHGAGYDEGQLQAFCRLFTAVCRVGLNCGDARSGPGRSEGVVVLGPGTDRTGHHQHSMVRAVDLQPRRLARRAQPVTMAL